MKEFVRCGMRFFSGSLVGAVLDAALTLVLLWCDLPIFVACFLGWSCAVLFTYGIHLRWTFSLNKQEAFLSQRTVRFCALACSTLAMRFLVLAIGEGILALQTPVEQSGLVLCSFMLSFLFNFIVAKQWIFQKA